MKQLFIKFIKIVLLAIIVIPYFSSCKDKDTSLNDKKELTSIEIIAGSEVFTAQLDSDEQMWYFYVNLDFDLELLKSAKVNYTVSKGTYASYPLSGSTHDFTVSPMGILATAEDGTEIYYRVEMMEGTSSRAEILDFSLQMGSRTIVGNIDDQNSRVYLSIMQPHIASQPDVVPNFTLSRGATADPPSGESQDFSQPVEYVITAHDGTIRKWTVEIKASETIFDYFDNSSDENCTLFSEAVRRAGLEEVFVTGNITCVVPNNDVWKAFLKLTGVSSVNEVSPILLKSFLEYLIFPGDYRAMTMNSGVNNKITTLSGDPIWLKSIADCTDGKCMTINDNTQELGSSPVNVLQEGYLFVNNVAAHVVGDFVHYKLNVAQTDGKPSGFEEITQLKEIVVSDDAFLYNGTAQRDQPQNDMISGVELCQRGTTTRRYGLLKFGLSDFMPYKILKVRLRLQLLRVNGYTPESDFRIAIREFPYSNWDETTVTWNIVRNFLTPAATQNFNPQAVAPNILAHTTGSIRCTGYTGCYVTSRSTRATYPGEFILNGPYYVYGDITTAIKNYQQTGEQSISLLLHDDSQPIHGSSAIDIGDKDWWLQPSVLEVTIPGNTAMTLVRNEPVILSDGPVTLNPDNHFSMTGPDVPDGYDYKDANIIYALESAPTNGVLTLYGLPLIARSRFTQAEMKAGAVKYHSFTGAPDIFTVRPFDYLDYSSEEVITISVQ